RAPDAMFRLGELYFEQSELTFNRASDAAAASSSEEAAAPSMPDYTRTVELYKQLVQTFPEYEQIDGVYYLLGYSMNEMGRPAEAVSAWLALTCANHFKYDANWSPEKESPLERMRASHPATADSINNAPPNFKDPYASCTAINADQRFV